MTARSNDQLAECARVLALLPDNALRLLDGEECRLVDAHLAACPACATSAQEIRDEMAVLTEVYAEEVPPASLWGKVDRRVADEREKVEAEARDSTRRALPSGSSLVRAASGGWRDTSVAGVRCRVLHEDAAQDRRTALYQMDPGAVYPAHVHGGVEECYVLSGDLSHGDVQMGPGDYQRVETASRHLRQATRDGCLLLIVCSMSDRLELE
jgi:anti-sigma factor ChrR (cupin superfamily)